ncbi:MAG: hypothetical protein A2527_08575 [Candidatus Lambdaproteobacteria bacterium RIFOXYD2_FULL_50_16]|uniref:Uncharacterized protein n=1 Tax=Candidatus Lambdaproteobacteria bacterium RIFOXYD2_FULL_50_16 TaxID=1817772 RepID=A0A1F6GAT2_9PROT|nr:MAG: hypothetical protein A2527_08575 [Candidatus Lambdaproteobacteria bacterium RIFOXYD2_FULL_50_16]
MLKNPKILLFALAWSLILGVGGWLGFSEQRQLNQWRQSPPSISGPTSESLQAKYNRLAQANKSNLKDFEAIKEAYLSLLAQPALAIQIRSQARYDLALLELRTAKQLPEQTEEHLINAVAGFEDALAGGVQGALADDLAVNLYLARIALADYQKAKGNQEYQRLTKLSPEQLLIELQTLQSNLAQSRESAPPERQWMLDLLAQKAKDYPLFEEMP